MIPRRLNSLKTQSFFLFGARGVGKSTYIRTQFVDELPARQKSALVTFNLLESQVFNRYFQNPDLLTADLRALKIRPSWVIIDEIQKIPKILDIVHKLIEEDDLKFVLTGSSARKLKRGAANLLAGRAFDYKLHPFVHLELPDQFNLEMILNWGSLPKIISLDPASRIEFLRAYALTYLKEEILEELLVRNHFAFRSFLKVAGQENGKLLNFNKLSRDLNIDSKTVESYFQILEDTLVGFFLPAYHNSIRKSVGQKPKFYIFDLGVKKALDETLDVPIKPMTSAYGHAFEHFVICEVFRLNTYARQHYSMFQYHTSAGGEIDLVLTKARQVIAIEIKSSMQVDLIEVAKLERAAEGIKASKIIFLSQDPVGTRIGSVRCLHWKEFFAEFFAKP
ncbi:MAG: ATP-binding protein [Bdellovibrionaceae bacterium]|nr:ATP-binding protein [Pseudobdellovibrionaceae bacterium]